MWLFVVALLDKTPIFECYMARFVGKNGHPT